MHVIEPAEKYGTSAVAPTLYTTDGITWITPYVSNGYSALSVVTERLVAHKTLGGGDGAAK